MWCIEAMRSQKCERLLIVVMLACSLVACRSQAGSTAVFACGVYPRRLEHCVLGEQRRDVLPVQG